MRKAAVLFPGIGYSCERPLLYYSGKLAKEADYEVIKVPYTGFPSGVKGNPEKMQQCFRIAREQTEKILAETDWSKYEEILFLSKSIGTAVACRYAAEHALHVRQILYTPLKETFGVPVEDAIAFHGTNDPWADNAEVEKACEQAGVPMYRILDANHSLETGETEQDLQELVKIMQISRNYILGSEK